MTFQQRIDHKCGAVFEALRIFERNIAVLEASADRVEEGSVIGQLLGRMNLTRSTVECRHVGKSAANIDGDEVMQILVHGALFP